MKLFDLVNRIEEDKELKTLFPLFINLLEYSANYILMHLVFAAHHLVVVLYPFQSYSLSKLLLDDFIDVELDDILYMIFVEIQKLFLHCCRASD